MRGASLVNTQALSRTPLIISTSKAGAIRLKAREQQGRLNRIERERAKILLLLWQEKISSIVMSSKHLKSNSEHTANI